MNNFAALPQALSSTFQNRLLHISSPLTWRGGEQQLWYLFQGLKNRGVDSLVFCPTGSELSKRLPDGQLITYKKRSGFDLSSAYKLKQVCTSKGIELIHVHDAHSHTMAVLASTLFGLKLPIVLSRRVDFPIGGSWFSRFKYNHASIKAVVPVSNAIASIIKPKLSSKHLKVHTIHSGVDLRRFENVVPADIKKELGLAESQPIIANVAALADHKDYFTFLDTVKLLHDSGCKASFVVFGTGPMESEIKAYCNQLELDQVVTFAGFRTDLPAVYPNIDVLLFTSKTEGLGTTILDAFASGVPVAATQAGGIPEMVIHNSTGLLAPVGDSETLCANVKSVLEDSDLRLKLTSNATSKVQEFTTDNMVFKTLELYQNILNKSFILKPV